MRLTFLEETFHCQKIVVMLKNKRQKRKQKNHVTQEAYSEPYNDVSRVFLGRLIHTLNPGKRHHDWHSGKNVSKLVLADALKLHPLALFALRFFCKTFPKFTLSDALQWDDVSKFKNSKEIWTAITLWDHQSKPGWKYTASSTEGIIQRRRNIYII